eukprot:tig00000459_g1137.t1
MITASDVAAVLGLNPYCSPNQGAPAPERISLKVLDQHGAVDIYRIKSTSRLEKLFVTHGRRIGVPADRIRFMFDGARIQPHQTPDGVGLQDGDEIDVMMEQVGGGRVRVIVHDNLFTFKGFGQTTEVPTVWAYRIDSNLSLVHLIAHHSDRMLHQPGTVYLALKGERIDPLDTAESLGFYDNIELEARYDPEAIHVTVNFNGHCIPYRLLPHMQIGRIFDSYRKPLGMWPDSMRILFNGMRVQPWQMPAEVGLSSGDEIDILSGQEGGGVPEDPAGETRQ